MKHLTQQELSARLDGAMSAVQEADADRHLATCESCRAALAELTSQDEALGQALEHDPGDAYFETFAARVEDRIRAAGLRGAQSKAWEGGALSWLRSPRRLTMVGVAAAVIGGAAIVIVTARMERPERALLESRSAIRSVPPAEPSARSQAAAPSESPAPRPADALAREEAKGERQTRQPFAGAPTLAKEKAASEELKTSASAPAPEPVAQSATPGRAMAAPRTDANPNAPAPAAGFAAPPPAVEGGAAKTLAARKAAPAGEHAQTLARDESSFPKFTNSAPATGELAAAQLCGHVVDAKGRPVAGALVALSDLGTTVETDAQGAFCLTAPAGTHPVTVLAMGYQQSQLDARPGSPPLEIQLRPVPVLEEPMATNPALDQSTADVAGAFADAPAKVRTGVAQAQASFAKAKVSGVAADYDVAAARWQKLVPGQTGAALQEARFRLAEARFQAWQASPNPTRARAATGALVAFLRDAGTGAKRTQAASWLARVLR